MRVDDPGFLDIGDRVRRTGNGPLYTVKALPAKTDPKRMVGIWHKINGWKAVPFDWLILVRKRDDGAARAAGPASPQGNSGTNPEDKTL